MPYNTQRKQADLPIPTESAEQQALFQWAALQEGTHPELSLLHHIPNGGSRHKAEARRLKAEGVKAGVPDLCLPVARGQYHGLYVELKRVKKSRASEEQVAWLAKLAEQGYYVAICKGWEEAMETILGYLRIPMPKPQEGKANDVPWREE